MSKGYVYILTNPVMPGLVKVGCTSANPETRAAQLYQTGVPAPFTVEHSVYSPDCKELEACIHLDLEGVRLSTSREFFQCEVAHAVRQLNFAHEGQVSVTFEEYLPDHVLIEGHLYVDPGDIQFLASNCGENPEIVADAMGRLTPDEITPAINRVYERMQRAKEKAEAGK